MAALTPEDGELVKLLTRAAAAMKKGDSEAQSEVLKAVGALGTGASVPFIADWLSTRSLSVLWPDLLEGILEGAEHADEKWREGVFRVLEKGLANPATPDRFRGWPGVSWPAVMMAVDEKRALQVFAKQGLLVLGAEGFAAAVDAINVSPTAVVPAEIAAQWLPRGLPDLSKKGMGEQYLLMLRAHAEHDLPETQRRLWELVERGEMALDAAKLLLKAEGLPDPVWKLSSRVDEVGLDKVRPAERTVWLVGNCFVFLTAGSEFETYAASSEADHLPEIVEALKEIGAPATARCLQEWARLFGEEWPRDDDERETIIEKRRLKPQAHWDKVCAGAEPLENVVALNLRYELSHADQFERTEQ
ncbi:hypothetical protein [Prosthecobacter sp.]|uniref:DMP19 family protein n=1 Tax=Prosthecobacter sp. TaxID=1965333 RepID=UPI003782F94A